MGKGAAAEGMSLRLSAGGERSGACGDAVPPRPPKQKADAKASAFLFGDEVTARTRLIWVPRNGFSFL